MKYLFLLVIMLIACGRPFPTPRVGQLFSDLNEKQWQLREETKEGAKYLHIGGFLYQDGWMITVLNDTIISMRRW